MRGERGISLCIPGIAGTSGLCSDQPVNKNTHWLISGWVVSWVS